MSEWKVSDPDHLDHDRISPNVSSKEAALAQARNLHRDKRAEIYKIEGPAGGSSPKKKSCVGCPPTGGVDENGRARLAAR